MAGARRILIADDEPDLRRMLTAYLKAEGFEPSVAADGPQTLERMRTEAPDLVVLDVGMPGIDGFEVLQRIRADSDVPVIMLTARSEEVDRVVGLTVGADDYVTKPFSPRELAARIKAVLRRGRRPGEEEVLRFPGLSMDLARREVLRDGEAVALTTLEFDLLAALASGPGRVFTRDQLLQRVWGFDYFGVDRVVDVHVANIRKALGDDAADPAIIGTVRGVGYRFLLSPA
ncbi:MAG TPA: response regulator transcription factor [Acidimicrobiia bacterium]|nr:response regulator transcription factor [Acidimicrobiia bacterium]